jgi:hypothetical protein
LPDIVSHFVQLQIDLEIVIVKILTELGDDGAVCEGDEFGIDLVYAGSCRRSASIKDCYMRVYLLPYSRKMVSESVDIESSSAYSSPIRAALAADMMLSCWPFLACEMDSKAFRRRFTTALSITGLKRVYALVWWCKVGEVKFKLAFKK